MDHAEGTNHTSVEVAPGRTRKADMYSHSTSAVGVMGPTPLSVYLHDLSGSTNRPAIALYQEESQPFIFNKATSGPGYCRESYDSCVRVLRQGCHAPLDHSAQITSSG